MMQLIVVAVGAIGLIIFVSFIAARLVRARTAGMSIRMQVFLALAMIVGAFALGLGGLGWILFWCWGIWALWSVLDPVIKARPWSHGRITSTRRNRTPD